LAKKNEWKKKKNNKYCSLTHRIILIKSNLSIKIELFNLTEKFENFDLDSCNNIFTPEIESIMLATKVLKGIRKPLHQSTFIKR